MICALDFGRLSRIGTEYLLGFAVVMSTRLPFGLAEFAFHRAALRRALRFVRLKAGAMAPVASR